jgi:iron complex transport system ATP-binding protein
MAAPPVLQAQRVSHGYGSHAVLDDISLSFHQGELVSLLGPNGCGKTTFLKILLGLLVPRSGTVLFQGKSIRSISPRQYARQVAYVPQIHRTAFPYTVEDVVAMGRIPHQSLWLRSSVKHLVWVEEALAKLEIAHLRKRAYTEISGGERQLTLIARALAQGASTIIMDEPTAALDYGHQIRLLEQLARLADQGLTCIKSTHTPEHALWVSSRVVLIKDGQVIADGRPDEKISPEALKTLYRVCVCVAHSETGVSAFVPTGLGRPGVLVGDQRNKPFQRASRP